MCAKDTRVAGGVECARVPRTLSTIVCPRSFWSLPLAGVVKISMHGVLLTEWTVEAFGYVVRDSEGTLLEASSFGFTYTSGDPMFVEAGVILWDLQEAWNGGWLDVVVESNCQVLVNRVKSHVPSFRFNFSIILELQAKFSSCSINFVPELTNVAAHKVARYGLSCSRCMS